MHTPSVVQYSMRFANGTGVRTPVVPFFVHRSSLQPRQGTGLPVEVARFRTRHLTCAEERFDPSTSPASVGGVSRTRFSRILLATPLECLFAQDQAIHCSPCPPEIRRRNGSPPPHSQVHWPTGQSPKHGLGFPTTDFKATAPPARNEWAATPRQTRPPSVPQSRASAHLACAEARWDSAPIP